MNDTLFESQFVLQSPSIDREDVDQEVALLQLQGITVNRRLVQLRLQSQNADAIFQGDPTAISQPLTTRTLPPHDVVEKLIDWAIDQSAEIGKAVLDFLVEPSDDELPQLVKKLKKAKLLHEPEEEKPVRPAGTLSQAIVAYVTLKPRSRDELYEYARVIHRAERPEAAVRQFLRRAVKEETFILTDGLYSLRSASCDQK